MTVKPRHVPAPHHHPAYSEGVRVNEACTEARRIIEAAREGRRLGGYDKARTDQ